MEDLLQLTLEIVHLSLTLAKYLWPCMTSNVLRKVSYLRVTLSSCSLDQVASTDEHEQLVMQAVLIAEYP